ncbi:hypothetical protein [Brevundimonas sp. LjRoot202]|uniref:hypothetical protein n=1 Tax=Brevundimonas sp. LjRoot202 TaxID=3342281 RepID=UPI003ECCD7B8
MTRQPKRPFGLGTYLLMVGGLAVVGAILGGGAALLGEQPGLFGLVLSFIPIFITMVIVGFVSIWWWRGIDEAAREAHKWAWWWGGSGGMAFGAILLITLTARDGVLPVATRELSAADLVVGGMMTILLFQLVGYAIAWAAWWLKRR